MEYREGDEYRDGEEYRDGDVEYRDGELLYRAGGGSSRYEVNGGGGQQLPVQ